LFRQPQLNDWDSVLAEVALELARWREERARERYCGASSAVKFWTKITILEIKASASLTRFAR